MFRTGRGSIAFAAFFVGLLILGILTFKNCYTEHRARDFGVWTSIASCSG